MPETSSSPLVLPPEQADLFREILTLLENRGVAYAVAGAFAMQEHTGICRDTKDLDVFLTAENAVRAIKYLKDEGFECEIFDPVWLFKAHRNEFFVDLITGMSNAAIIVDESWIERSVPAVIHGVNTRVLAAEELLASKLFIARRERFDGADIAHIIYGTRGKIDWQRCSDIGRALGDVALGAGIVPLCLSRADRLCPREMWGSLLSRFQEAFSLRPKEKFRGSLIDDKMFAIDVK